jgi:hypothetical protein
MFDNLISEPLVSYIIKLSNQIDESILFHRESYESMRFMSKLEFISKVFEANLMEEKFLLKKWADYEIPHLIIYQDNNIDLKFHIFSPCSSGKKENASYLIHHHGNNILSSFVFFGSGYKSIHFDKEILKNQDGTFNLKVNKIISHLNGNINIVPSWVPHLVSNVESTTATIVLWSEDKKSNQYSSAINEIRMSYFYENGKYFGINEQEFIIEVNKISEFENDSEKHIQSICYLMQKLGYVNNVLLKKIINNSNTPKSWVKYLKLLFLEKNIEAPIFNMKINTLNKEIRIGKRIN